MIKFAVISFPGTNCENESIRAFKRNGMEAELVLWNDEGVLNGSRLNEFDGYCIAGGFSYEDRGRSGVVAAKDPIMEVLKKEAANGKVVLGICNGAQILVETGLVPGYEDEAIGMALAWNEMKVKDQIVDTGFYNDWAYLKNTAPKDRSAFNGFDELLHVPFAHGEGRFMIDQDLLEVLEKNDQILFKYATKEGEVSTDYPVTPNGATASVAGLCNPAGNVMAIMPHPERDPLGGTGDLIFKSIKGYIEKNEHKQASSIPSPNQSVELGKVDTYDIEIYVRLIITDNTERTIEEACKRIGVNVELQKYNFYGINLADSGDAKAALEKILDSGELANLNKHLVYVKVEGKTYQYLGSSKFNEKEINLDSSLVVQDKEDFVGQAKKQALNSHLGNLIEEMSYGIMWKPKYTEGATRESLAKTGLLHNHHSMNLLVHGQ